jgi:hypothetical protein
VEAAGPGDDRGRGRDEVEAEAVALKEHRALLGADERGELVEHAGDELVDRLALEQRGGGADDLLEAELVRLDGAQVAIRADGADDGGGQALGGDLGLVAVVVDVVVEHHPLLGRVAGLPGAQDDADARIPERAADPPHELEAGVLGLHDDVEQDHRDVEVALQHHASGGRRVYRQDRQRVAVDAQFADGQPGDVVDLRLVVDDQQLPHPGARGLRRRVRGVVGEHEGVEVIGRGGHRLGSTRIGRRIVTWVPCCGVELTSIVPPSRSVTRLWTMCMPRPLPPRPRWVVKNGLEDPAQHRGLHADAVVPTDERRAASPSRSTSS